MKDTAAARRYSRALFLAIREQKLPLADLQKQLQKAAQLVRTDAALYGTLNHAFLPSAQKQTALRQALDRARAAVSPLVLNFFDLLLKKGRIGLLPLILADFDRAVDESRGVVKASVKSAVPLNDGERKALERELSKVFGKETVVEASTDPELLAGIVVRAGDRVIDNSLRSQLKNLKTSLEQTH